MSWKLKEYERSAYTVFEIIDESSKTIEKFAADENDYAEKKKKAQLIAAAPEMLEVLEMIFEIIWENGYFNEPEKVADIEDVINKAKGADE